nr:aldose 1-epimerase family protein [Angustibacter aerolatus]
MDGFAEHEHPVGGRGQTLVPWPNRVAGATYDLDGEPQQLDVTEPSTGCAIHGLARWTVWDVEERSDAAVTLRTLVVPQPGWPTALDVRVRYLLDDDGLQVTTTARNVGDRACPYGTGHHPYLSAGTETVDDVVLRLPGTRWYAVDERGIPTGGSSVDGTGRDRRTPRPVGDEVIDTAYGDLERDADGRWRVRLTDAAGGSPVTLWGDAAYGWLQVFSGDTLPEPLRRKGLAVEPMTCPPNAFVTGEGVVRLEPGDEHTATWGLSPS